MKLPPTFFYNFLKENTFFVVDNKIYNPTPLYPNGLVLAFNGKKFHFNEGLKLSDLEKLYFQNNDAELKRYGNEVLRNILSNEQEISEDYHKLGQEIELVEFILYNLLKKEKEEDTIKILAPQKEYSCLIDKLFNQNCFVWQGRLYLLQKESNSLFSVKIGNKEYGLGDRCQLDLEELEKKYIKNIEEKICHNLTTGKESLLRKVEKLKGKKKLIEIIKKKEFYDHEEDIGLKICGEGFFVTKKIKPYVLYEPQNKKYYGFGEALIGVKLEKQNKKISWKDPVVINPYIHPALPSKERKPCQKICNGKFEYSKAVKGRSIEEALRIILAEAKRMILNGYFGEKGAWHCLTETQFQSLEVTKFNPKEVANQ